MLRNLVSKVARKVESRGKSGPAPSTMLQPVHKPAPSPTPVIQEPTGSSIAERIASLSKEEGSGQEVLHADGYWGPIENESSRAKAEGETLVIDQEECIACGTCVENAETVFVLPDDAKAVVIAQEGPMDRIQDAIDACPVTCIQWSDRPEAVPQLNDQEGEAVD